VISGTADEVRARCVSNTFNVQADSKLSPCAGGPRSPNGSESVVTCTIFSVTPAGAAEAVAVSEAAHRLRSLLWSVRIVCYY
jgi:hypothetical protein